MRAAVASILVLQAVFASTGSASCVESQGIATGGGEGLLDLSVLLNASAPGIVPAVKECSSELETPIGMRLFTALDAAQFSLGNMFESNGVALDIFGDKETSDARRRCQPADGDEDAAVLFNMHLGVAGLYMVAYVGSEHMPWCTDTVSALMEAYGAPLSMLDVADASTDTPWGLAKAYVDEVMSFLMENDGWNADGGLGGKEFNRIPFTGDFYYTDSAGNEWNGYTPKNTPYKFKRTKRWQPLLESDGLGYITAQEHVTPHIGVTARFFGFDTAENEEAWGSRKLDAPSYRNRHDEIAREVLEASKLAADDPAKQFAISFFDNKATSLLPLMTDYFAQRRDTLSRLEFFKVNVKLQLGIYNGVVLSWREKVRHDAPRPPSVVRNEIGDEIVEAYAGPDNGVQNMTASEWEPYIRTMPHSEYPSASSCLCEAFASALRVWAGTDTIDPPLGQPEEDPLVTFASWSEISEMCGDSRVWAGLHFEESVPAGVELCGGDEMAISIAASIDGLTAGDESVAVFNRDIGELMLRPL
ncbi:unnamed protein product [Ectocarpus sp. 6 AP-2014]